MDKDQISHGYGNGNIEDSTIHLMDINHRRGEDLMKYTGMSVAEWVNYYSTAMEATGFAKLFVSGKNGEPMFDQDYVKRKWKAAEKFIIEELFKPKFMDQIKKQDVLGPHHSTAYKEAINESNPCAGQAQRIVMELIEKLRKEGGYKPYSLLTFAGEGDCMVLAFCPDGEDCMLDVQCLLVFRYLFYALRDLSKAKRNILTLPVDTSKFLELTEGWENPKLITAFEILCNPDDDELKKMKEEAHDASIDAQMTARIFYVCIQYQRDHLEAFNRYGDVSASPATFTYWVRKMVNDLDTPLGSKNNSDPTRSAQAMLRNGDRCKTLCAHA